MILQAVIFDKDGVLIDTEPMIAVAIRETIKEFGGKGYFSFEDKMEVAGMTAKDLFVKLQKKHNISTTFEKYIDFEKKRYFQLLEENPPQPLPGIINLLKTLADKGIKVAVGTGSSRKSSDKTLSYSKLAQYFEVVVTEDDVKKGKPDPETFIKAAEMIGVDPENAVVLGDSINDYHAAKEAGMKFVHITVEGYKAEGYNPDLVIESVDKLTVEMLEKL